MFWEIYSAYSCVSYVDGLIDYFSQGFKNFI